VIVVELPTGTVTLVFTDIEGSTRMLRSLGDGYGAVLRAHRAILRAAVSRHGGVEFGTEGDACFLAFPAAQAALAAAAEAQAALAAADWPEGAAPRVRMGVHTGSPVVVDDDYVGIDVHRVARICSAAHGGQVLVSGATRDAASGDPALRDLGHHRLKDLDRPERLYQLLGAGLAEDFPAPRSLPSPSNLPAVPTSFVGREAELAEVGELLARPGLRLLTLTGPGGTGKTRLALETCRTLAPRFPDGVWFVPLATVTDPARVGLAVVQALRLPDPMGRASIDAVAEHLGDWAALLLLDNFEHLAEVASWVGELLGRAPQLRLLVTSRVVLGLTGEHEYPVRPLPQESAATLFAQRAQAVRPRFSLEGNGELATVSDICARLDGLPLAIELAAARLRLLSLDDLRRGLQDRLPLLTSRARDLPERQRTLRNTIDWSYRLLAPDEQALLRRLSVFVGGCTWSSAEAVAGGDDSPVDGLETLVEHSLVWYEETATATRYRMLATIREYAGERLEQAGERDALRRGHAEWFAARAQEAYLSLDSEDQMGSLDWYDAEMDNVRAALAWALEQPRELARGELALSLVRSLGYVWYTRGLTREALSWLDQLRAADGGGPPGLRGVLLYWIGAFATRQGRSEQAAGAYQEAVELFREADDPTRVAKTLNALGDVAVSQGDTAEARRRWNEALALARQDQGTDARHTEAFVTANLGDLAFEEGDLAEARELLERAIELLAPRGDRWATAIVQRYLAKVLAAQGERPRAYALLSASLSLLRAWSERTELADTLEILATLAAQEGEDERVVRLLAGAAAIRGAAGSPLGDHQRALLARALAPASAALGRDVFELAAGDVAWGRALTFDQVLDYAAAWADQRSVVS
jgi:predicted ATPase/class 3 adenylate cyclase/Tfp pilus assembly protein PilF